MQTDPWDPDSGSTAKTRRSQSAATVGFRRDFCLKTHQTVKSLNKTKSLVPTIIEQQQFWDWHWQNWRERKTVNSWKECRHEAILSVLGSLPIDRPRILDLGCGHG